MPRASANVEGLAQQQPNQERCGGNADDGGNEDAGNFIGRLGKRGLGSGGVAHQTDDLGQRRVLADALGTAGRAPFWLMVAALTGEPGNLSTGMLSPVRAASFTVEMPSATVPSTGMLSPGRATRNRSPTADLAPPAPSTCSPVAQHTRPCCGASSIRLLSRVRWCGPCCAPPANLPTRDQRQDHGR